MQEVLADPKTWVLLLLGVLLQEVIAPYLRVAIRWLKRGAYLTCGLYLNAILLPLIATSPYSTLYAHWFWDLLGGAAFGGVYWIIANLDCPGLRRYAFFAPHSTVAAMLGIAWHIGVPDSPLITALLIYPLVLTFHVAPILAWIVVLAVRSPYARD